MIASIREKKGGGNSAVGKQISLDLFDKWARQNGIKIHPDVVIGRTNHHVSECEQGDELSVYYDLGNALKTLFASSNDSPTQTSNILSSRDDLQIDSQTAKAALSSKLELTLHKDTELASIPKAAVLSPTTCAIANLFEEFATIEEQDEGEQDDESSIPPMVALVIAFIYEAYIAREKSPWYGYLQLFAYRDEHPHQEDPIPSASLPRFWTKDEKEWLKGSEINVVEGLDDSESIYTYNEFVMPFLSASPGYFPESLYKPADSTSIHTVFSYPNYVRASIKVASRAFEVDSFIGLGLVPFADLLNHSDYNNACFQSDFDVCFYCGEIECEHMSHDGSSSSDESESVSYHSSSDDDLLDSQDFKEQSNVRNMVVKDDDSEMEYLDQEYDSDSQCAIVAARDIAINVKDSIITSAKESDKISYSRRLFELFNTYGPLGNDVLVSRYGFLISRNRYSCLSLGRLLDRCIRTAQKELRKKLLHHKRPKSSSQDPHEELSKRSIDLQRLAEKISIPLKQLIDNWKFWVNHGKEIFDTLLKCDPQNIQEEEDEREDGDDIDNEDWAIDNLYFQCRADEPVSPNLVLCCLILIASPRGRKELLANLLQPSPMSDESLISVFSNSSQVSADQAAPQRLPRRIVMNIYRLTLQNRSEIGKLLLFLWRLRQSKYHDGGITFEEYAYVAKSVLPPTGVENPENIHEARKRLAIEIITDEKWILDQALRVIERLNA